MSPIATPRSSATAPAAQDADARSPVSAVALIAAALILVILAAAL